MTEALLTEKQLRQTLNRLINARRDAIPCLQEMLSAFQTDKLPSADTFNTLNEALLSVLHRQEECFTLVPTNLSPPETVSDMEQLAIDLERSNSLSLKVEQVRQDLILFAQLHCLNEELVEEITHKQEEARQLLLQSLSDEELLESAEKYVDVITLVRDPAEIDRQPNLLEKIRKSLHFTTKHAVANGWLVLPTDQIQIEAKTIDTVNSVHTDTSVEAVDTEEIPHSEPAQLETTDSAVSRTNESIEQRLREYCIDFDTADYRWEVKNKDKSVFSANKFEGELKQLPGPAARSAYMLAYIYNYGLLASSQLEKILKIGPFDSARASLAKLSQKGYLVEHTLTIDEMTDTCYTFSEYGANSFRKETSRKWILTRSPLKLIPGPAMEHGLEPNASHSVAVLLRLRLVNAFQLLLGEKVPKALATLHAGILPFPHRVLRKRDSGLRFLLIPGMLDASEPQNDLAYISDTLALHPDAIPIFVVQFSNKAMDWIDQFATAERAVYYTVNEDGAFAIYDKDNIDCLPRLFDLAHPQEAEHEDESITPIIDQSENTIDLRPVADDSSFENALANADVESISAPSGAQQISPDDEPHTASISPDELNRVVETALQMLAESRKAEGMALLHSVTEYSEDVRILRDKLGFVFDDPLVVEEDWHSLADTPVNLTFQGSESLEDCLNASMWLKIFFEPDNPNDYRLTNRWKQIKSDLSSRVLTEYESIKQLISYFWSIIERHHVGMKYCTSSDVRNQLDITHALEQCRQQIEETLNTVFPRNVTANINHPKVHQMIAELYGNSGLLTRALQNSFDMPIDELKDICQKFTLVDLSADLDNSDIQPHDNRLEEFLDKHWAEMKFKSDADKSTTLKGALRNRMRSRLQEATIPLLNCYAYRNQEAKRQISTNIPPDTVKKVQQGAHLLLGDALRQLGQETDSFHEVGLACLRHVIHRFQEVISEQSAKQNRAFYEPLLLSGEVELNQDGLPILDEEWLINEAPIEGYRLWERLLRHCGQQLPSWEEAALRSLRRYDLGMYEIIARRTGACVDEAIVEETHRKADMQRKKYKSDFMTEVESAQNYGQMASNDEMHGYFRLVESADRHAALTGNVGFFKRLLEACQQRIVQGSDARIAATRNHLEALRKDILQRPDRDMTHSDEEVWQQWPILSKIAHLLELRNMTVAEDYIQLAKQGQKDTPIVQQPDQDLYMRFEAAYQSLFNACNSHRSEDLNRTYEQSVRSLLYPNQNNRNTANAEKFIRLWGKPHQLAEFMEQLIFSKVDKVERRGREGFIVYPAARDVRMGQYPHPFEAFGTRAVRNGVLVLTMAGVRTASNVIDEVAQIGANDGSATIVLLDYALPLAERRLLSKSIKLRAMSEVLVVDRVMALFLAGCSQIERGNAFLMTALPSSKIQPYIPVGVIPPEMFIGRTEELDKIQNLNGPVFVYGGRQLGKTALLRESRNREHDPENGRYAIFIDLREKNIDQSLRRISEELVAERVLQRVCSSWEDLRSALRERLRSSERPIRKLILLLDEADAFIADCERQQDRPLEMLKELKDSFNDRFKFVLAGLRDVVRFNKQRLGRNNVLAHMGHITIRPLKYLDARDLLLRPLQYLGFRIEANSEEIISLILAKTNYYPGLIHFYCQKLIEAISDSYRNGNYTEHTAPPYGLDEKHIKTLLGQSDFLTEIEKRFRITLQLHTDDLYDILAKAIAYHYHVNGVGQSASVQEITGICEEFSISKICELPEESVEALLEEMVELNILRHEAWDTMKYAFNRYAFFQMLGNEEQVFEELLKYMD